MDRSDAAAGPPPPSALHRSVSSSAAQQPDAGGVDILGANWGLRLDFAASSLPQRPSRIRRSQTADPGLEHVSSHDHEPPPPVVASAMLHALQEDEDLMLPKAPPPHLLRRSITFSGVGGDDSPLLVPPPLPDVSDLDQRRRATSDAAAVAAAWGESSQAQAQSSPPLMNYTRPLPPITRAQSAAPDVRGWGKEDQHQHRTMRSSALPQTSNLGMNASSAQSPMAGIVSPIATSASLLPNGASTFVPMQQQQQHHQVHMQQQQQQQMTMMQGFQQHGVQPPPNVQDLSMMMSQMSMGWPPAGAAGAAVLPAVANGMMDPAAMPGMSLEQQFAQIQLMQQQWLMMMQEQMAQAQVQQQQQQQQRMPGSGSGMPFRGGPMGGAGGRGMGIGRMDPGVAAFTPGVGPMGRGGPRGVGGGSSMGAGGGMAQNLNGGREPSQLLQEHKLSGKRLSSQELMGHVVEFSRDSHGSRLVQFKMETGTPEERRMFVGEALPQILSLARDLFGNYVLQNFFDHCEPEQRDEMAKAMRGSISSLCEHPHGCRVVQRALMVTTPARRNDMIFELLQLDLANGNPEAVVRTCSRDAHATHVLQKAVQLLQAGLGHKATSKEDEGLLKDPSGEIQRSQRALDVIEACIEKDAMPMMTHQQASRLVQRVLGPCDVQSSPRVERLVKEVFRNMDALAIHQNGNFVLQHILEYGDPTQRATIQAYACLNAVRLAMHKFGSHLVEKCLACATPSQVAAIIDRFLLPPPPDVVYEFRMDESDASMALPLLMSDAYANFVVQKAFDVSRGETRLKLSKEIRQRTVALSKFSYGRHILAHINREHGAVMMGNNGSAP